MARDDGVQCSQRGMVPLQSVPSPSCLWSLLTKPVRTFIPLSFLPHLPRFLRPPSPTSSTSRSITRDPTTTSLSFVRDLETLTGNSASAGTLPEFWIGPYRDFLTAVRKGGRIGCVILVCGEHENDEEFKRDVLCDPEFVRCIKENEIMVWGADIRGREGYQGRSLMMG